MGVKRPQKIIWVFLVNYIDYLAIDSYYLVGHNEWFTCDIYMLLQYIIVPEGNFNTCLSINQLILKFYFIKIKIFLNTQDFTLKNLKKLCEKFKKIEIYISIG